MYFNCGVGEDLRVSWTARRSNQSTLKEISPEDSLEGLMLKLKLQYLGHLMQRGRNINEPKIELFSHISCCPENGVQILFLGTEADLNYSGPYRNVISMIVSKYGLVSVQFSCSVMSSSLWPHELQHARPPCPSPTPGVHPNPCPLSRWCHPTISSSVIPFSSCTLFFPASGSGLV